MASYEVRLVNELGKTVGYGDRWWTHRVTKGREGPVLGQKHLGMTIVCVDECGKILVAHRRHKIFDRVWTLSGDTHPYRMKGSLETENIFRAARRCATDDLGAKIEGWTRRLTVSYSARDPRDSKYCENELLHVMVAKYDGPLHMNKKNAYELRWAELADISKDSVEDLRKEPIDRKYAPWVHALFALPPAQISGALSIR
jgi:isopentenyldiphosphate isomerase